MCDGNPYEEHENCHICGQDAAICQCPVCPVCTEQGNLNCFTKEEPHMPLSALIAALEAPGLDNSDAGIVLNILGMIFSDYDSPAHMCHSIYDSTKHGAWIAFLTWDSSLIEGQLPDDSWNSKLYYGIYGFEVGSTVEGTDQETEIHTVQMYPLSTVKDRLFAALDLVEAEAKAIWEDTHPSESEERTNTMKIKKVKTRQEMFLTPSRENQYLVINPKQGTMYCEILPQAGVPEAFYNNRMLRYKLPMLRRHAANQLMLDILPLAKRIEAGYEEDCRDGSNLRGYLNPDASDADISIEAHISGMVLGHDDGLSFWDANSADMSDWAITADTTDEEIAAEVAELLENYDIAEGAVDAFTNHRDHLKTLVTE